MMRDLNKIIAYTSSNDEKEIHNFYSSMNTSSYRVQ